MKPIIKASNLANEVSLLVVESLLYDTRGKLNLLRSNDLNVLYFIHKKRKEKRLNKPPLD